MRVASGTGALPKSPSISAHDRTAWCPSPPLVAVGTAEFGNGTTTVHKPGVVRALAWPESTTSTGWAS
ncbi:MULTISPECIES: hypothetical protein [Streptomyces]|uniref:hypothetical protein n=1 Tax=Streptomyces TaxID=1883 RepID=UPI0016876A9F|nr:hypothetical protein [Streptomyces venezuelae]